MWWVIGIIIVVMLASIVSVFMMMPKEPPPPGITPLAVPSTTTGKVIPVLFGSRMIGNSSVTWWGDLAIVMVASNAGGKKG